MITKLFCKYLCFHKQTNFCGFHNGKNDFPLTDLFSVCHRTELSGFLDRPFDPLVCRPCGPLCSHPFDCLFDYLFFHPFDSLCGCPFGPLYSRPCGPLYSHPFDPPFGPLCNQPFDLLCGLLCDPLCGPLCGPLYGPRNSENVPLLESPHTDPTATAHPCAPPHIGDRHTAIVPHGASTPRLARALCTVLGSLDEANSSDRSTLSTTRFGADRANTRALDCDFGTAHRSGARDSDLPFALLPFPTIRIALLRLPHIYFSTHPLISTDPRRRLVALVSLRQLHHNFLSMQIMSTPIRLHSLNPSYFWSNAFFASSGFS